MVTDINPGEETGPWDVGGVAWFMIAVNTLRRTDHFEGYPFVFAALMVTQGALAYWVHELRLPASH